jgi:choline dehydrogenase
VLPCLISPTSPSQRFIYEDGVINVHARVLRSSESCLNVVFYSCIAPEYVRYI